MKKTDKILWAIGAVFLIALVAWGICETAGSDFYNYEGYVIGINQDEKSQTMITTVSGDKTHEFVLKWYSYKRFEKKKQEIAVGDRVMLTTTHFSNTDIKKISVNEGYSIEGKVVYTNELPDKPFLLAIEPSLNLKYFVSIVYPNGELSDKTGESVRIYHPFPIYEESLSVLVNASVTISEKSDLTEEEIAFVESKGYTVKK